MTPIILEGLDAVVAVVVPVIVALLSVCAKATPNRVVVLNPRIMIIPIAETDSIETVGNFFDDMFFFVCFITNR
jgi:hypothetical protein